MSSSQATSHTSPDNKLGTRARGQLAMLTAEFLLGTGVSLIGLPSETSGTAKAATSTLLGVHILIAVGLIVGAVLTIRQVPALQSKLRSQAWTGAAVIAVTVAAGVLTMILKSNWWTFLMAVGFIASYILYGSIYLRARSA